MDQKKIQRLLAGHAFFKDMSLDQIRTLAGYAAEESVSAQHLIFQQDRPADRFYLLLEGRAAIEIPALYGAPVTIQELSAGAVLGWSWLIPPFRWTFNARALTDAKLLAVDGLRVREECERDPRLGYDLMKRFAAMMSERLAAARLRVMEVTGSPGSP